MQLKSLAVFGAIGLLTLAGCSSASKTTTAQPTETQPTSVASQPEATGAVNTPQAKGMQSATPEGVQTNGAPSQYPELSLVVANTQKAVETGDFTQAQQAFDQFEDAWSPVEDGIKEKSADSYNAIEETTDQVNAALRSSNKAEALTALQLLNDHISQIPQ